jgi:multisubunit Na+/H+ antiporter MnhE subunit
MDRTARAAGGWLLRWVALAALWLAFTDTHVEPELIAGAVAAAIGATLAGLVIRPGPPKTVEKGSATLRLGPWRLLKPLVRLVVDTGVVAAALWRRLVLRKPVRGSFRVVRYRPGPERRSAAGRTLTEIWGSLMPNRYVVGIDEEGGTLLVHELVRTEQPLDPLSSR